MKTSLTPGESANDTALSAPPEGAGESQTPTTAATQSVGPEQSVPETPQHEPAIPYQRFQQVTHENQSLRQQVADYQARQQQVQANQYQATQGNTGMAAPQGQLNQQQQAQVDRFRDQLKDPKQSKEWQTRIAKEGPAALHDFVEAIIRESGQQLLNEALQPIGTKLQLLEGDYVSSTLNQFRSQVNDPEYAAYGHIFENAIRELAPKNNIRDPVVLDTVRHWARSEYQRRYGNPPVQQQQAPQPQYQQQNQPQFQPPFSERPGTPVNFYNSQPQQSNPFAASDAMLAQKFGLTNEQVAQARSRTVRGG